MHKKNIKKKENKNTPFAVSKFNKMSSNANNLSLSLSIWIAGEKYTNMLYIRPTLFRQSKVRVVKLVYCATTLFCKTKLQKHIPYTYIHNEHQTVLKRIVATTRRSRRINPSVSLCFFNFRIIETRVHTQICIYALINTYIYYCSHRWEKGVHCVKKKTDKSIMILRCLQFA